MKIFGGVLTREVVYVIISTLFYNTLIQATSFYRSKTWVIKACMPSALEAFYAGLTRGIMKM